MMFTDSGKDRWDGGSAEAVALVIDSGRSVKDVAESLGIHENTLGNWIAKAKEQGDVPEKPPTLSERAELDKLRRDYAPVQLDLAFLKNQRPGSRPCTNWVT